MLDRGRRPDRRGPGRPDRHAGARPPRAPTSACVATAAEIATWPVGRGAGACRSAPTSPATSSTPPAAPASRAACWSRQRAIAGQRPAIAVHGLALRADDRCISWLPLYHDMGLVGCCLTPVMAQITVDYLPTTGVRPSAAALAEAAVRAGRHDLVRPDLRLRALHAPRAVGHARGPRPVALAGRRHRRRDDPGQRAGRVRRALRRRRASTQSAFLPSYGLAEATLAVTFAPLGQGVQRRRGRPRPDARGRAPAPCRPTAQARRQARTQLRPVRPADAGLRGRDPRRRRTCRCPSGRSAASASRARA